MRDAFVAGLLKEAVKNPNVLLVTGDLGFGVLNEFRAQVPNQFINAGVAEQNMTGIATGLALNGKIVFTYSIGNFPTLRCLEQIRNDAAYHDANVKVVSVGGGFTYGSLGMSHHATEDLSIMRALPITVVAPGDDYEAEQAAAAIIRQPGTCYVRVERAGAAPSPEGGEFEIGKARQIRQGTDLTLIACGGILVEAIEAAKQLSENGIQSRVLSMHTLRPLDEDSILRAAIETGGIITLEENTIKGGLGGAVAETCLANGVIPGFFRMVGLRGGFASQVGSQSYLKHAYGMDASYVVKLAVAALSKETRVSL